MTQPFFLLPVCLCEVVLQPIPGSFLLDDSPHPVAELPRHVAETHIYLATKGISLFWLLIQVTTPV